MIARALPSFLTVGNLFLGIISIILAFNRQFDYAALTVIIGMVLDGLDGRVARMLGTQSEFGKELDSLSDVISFGVAPAFIMYGVVLSSLDWIGTVITAIFPICGALRLARFNTSISSASPNYFVGLPITAAGGVLATMALYHDFIPSPSQPIVFPIAMLGLSYLMISRVKYPNFKKVGIPKSAFYMVPLILLLVIVVFIFYPNQVNKLLFLPLAVYAFYGFAKKGNQKRLKSDSKEPVSVFKKNRP